MNELTIEQKAELYDKAIERGNSLLSCNELGNAWVYKLLPELKESEGEQIRKWIIDDIRFNISLETLDNSEYKKKAEKAIEWLEKECDQKFSWSKEDEKKRTLLIKILEANHPHGLFKVNSSETMQTEELVSWLESINYKI